jgi:hypothetical protein
MADLSSLNFDWRKTFILRSWGSSLPARVASVRGSHGSLTKDLHVCGAGSLTHE